MANDPLPGFFGYQPSDPQFSDFTMGPYLDPWSRDWVTRVLMGEVGKVHGHRLESVGVTEVVKRRASESGASPGEVVLAPHQFEPVQKRGIELAGYDPESPAYKDASKVVDNVFWNKGTGPYNNFYSPSALAARGQPMPAWGGSDLLDRQVFGEGAFNPVPKLQEGLRFPTPPGPAAPYAPQSVAAAGPTPNQEVAGTGFMPPQGIGIAQPVAPLNLPTPTAVASSAPANVPMTYGGIPVTMRGMPPMGPTPGQTFSGLQAGMKQIVDALGTTSKAEASSDHPKGGASSLDQAKGLALSGMDPALIAQQTGWMPVGNYWKFVGPGGTQ